MIPANLIINADDFGLDRRVSRAIALCVERGLVNSFSVLPFADPEQDALLRSVIAKHPGVRVGAHLSLIDTPSASPGSHGYAGLREHPGHFRDFLRLYLLGRYPPSRIYAEWKAQILLLGEYLGGPDRIAHLDSHQHLHVLPGIWPVAVALQREFGIPRLRAPYESMRRALFHKPPFGIALQALAALRHRSQGGSGSDGGSGESRRLLGFVTSTCFTVEGNRAGLEKVLARPEQAFELMVHPALPPDPDAAGTGDPADPSAWTVQSGQVREMEELERLPGFFRSLSAAARPAAT